MSAIMDALNKTQSAIDKKPYSDRSLYGDIKIPHHDTTSKTDPHAALLHKKKKPFFSAQNGKAVFSIFTHRYFILLSLGAFLSFSIWFGYQHDQPITTEISKIKNSFIAQPKTTIAAQPAQIPLILDGTVRVDTKRDALINQQLYKVGDTIDGYLILEIHDGQVKLLDRKTLETSVLKTNLS